MSVWRDFDYEMQRFPLDTNTADRLLAGSVAPEDAPPGYGGVALLLAALADAPSLDPRREEEAIAEFGSAVRSSQLETTTRSRRSQVVPRLKLAAALATLALAGTSSLAVAGGLPGAAQDIASEMLAKVGVTVPGPNENSGDHPTVRGRSADAPVAPATEPSEDASSGKGAEVSALATGTDLTGVEKGAAISTLASGGKSQAGQHGQATAEHGSSATASDAGRAIADQASGGHSAAGSANSTTGQSHRP